MREAARRLRRGFIVLFDYGHRSEELYSVTHASGTLTSFSAHVASGPESVAAPWLRNPGSQDITAHVDFSTIERVAHEEGLTTAGFLDQTYFVMGILQSAPDAQDARPALSARGAEADAKRARALKTLMMPGGLGSTMKVLILAKGVGSPALIGCSFRMRVT